MHRDKGRVKDHKRRLTHDEQGANRKKEKIMDI